MSDDWPTDTFVDEGDLFLPELERRVAEKRHETADLCSRLRSRTGSFERVLDVACGPGVHAVDVAERGFRVDGIDIAEEYVEAARRRAAEAGVADRTSFRTHDMRDLPALDREYDAVTNRYSSFGYYDDETNRGIVDATYDLLAPGGVFALELRNREAVLAARQSDAVRTLDGQLRIERRDYAPESARLRTDVEVFDPESMTHCGGYELDRRLYAPVEAADLFERAGFSVDLAASFAGDDLAPTDEWFVVYGTRPD